ncbi:hypothetical protein BV898_02723 [Hypsibius exemplaris]|uniref:Uncharacterized protein n=1 Tax=Hypsibius exemplaris TaxID=2072580 RepID=A0A1W0X7N8_HYPEX|nr:hypothetical protein BV898_02723 [Hypsibius exemplaris]
MLNVGCLECSGVIDVLVASAKQGQNILIKELNVTSLAVTNQLTDVYCGGVWIRTLQMLCKALTLRCKLFEEKAGGNKRSINFFLAMHPAGLRIWLSVSCLCPNWRLQNFSAILSPICNEYSLLIHHFFLSNSSSHNAMGILSAFSLSAWAAFTVVFCLTIIGSLLSHNLRRTAALQEPLQNSKDPHLRFLGARMVPFPPIDEAFVQSRIARPPQERIAYLIPPPSYATLAKYSCDYVVAIPKVFSTRTAPFWFRRDSQLFDKFSHKYAWAASGATILHNSPQFSII